jgi:hypothetical protein
MRGNSKIRAKGKQLILFHLLDQNLVTFANFFPLTNDRKVYETIQRSLS